MYIVIKSCNDPIKFYADMIGRTFYAYKIDDAGYWVRDENGFSNVVSKEDVTEIVKRN